MFIAENAPTKYYHEFGYLPSKYWTKFDIVCYATMGYNDQIKGEMKAKKFHLFCFDFESFGFSLCVIKTSG